jgi:hypothetical protein
MKLMYIETPPPLYCALLENIKTNNHEILVPPKEYLRTIILILKRDARRKLNLKNSYNDHNHLSPCMKGNLR